MLQLTRLPQQVSYFLRGTKQFFHYRHHLVFCWTLVLILICQDKATLCGLARFGPKHLCEWHIRRFLSASYWSIRLVLWWFVDALLAVLPPPQDGVVRLIGDGTYKGKTGQKNPLAKKGRIRAPGPYLFGIHIIILMLHWDNFRIPIDFEIVKKKDSPGYKKPNALFRWMLVRFKKPVWATRVIVLADAEFAAKETLNLIKRRGYFFVMSMARTWKFEDDRSLKHLVRHLPRKHYQKIWIKAPDGRRRVYWIFTKSACLRHLGDVTIVLSKKRRNDGPNNTIILVTNLPNVSGRQVVMLYTGRWNVELLIKELKGVTGLGQAQVTKDAKRVERSIALSLMAYLLLIKFCWRDIPQNGAWSAFQLKRNFAFDITKKQLVHSFQLKLRKLQKHRLVA